MVPDAVEVRVSGVFPEQTLWAPEILPATISFTLTVKVSSLKQPEAFMKRTETTSPSEKVVIEAE